MAIVDLKSNLSNIKKVENLPTHDISPVLDNSSLPVIELFNKFYPGDPPSNILITQGGDFLSEYYARARQAGDLLAIRRLGRVTDVRNEPFIIRDIGQRYGGFGQPIIGHTTDTVRGGFTTAVDRYNIDRERISAFLRTGAGSRFLLKQGVLQLLNPFAATKIYNPLSLYSVPGLINIRRPVINPVTRVAGELVERAGEFIDRKIADAKGDFIQLGAEKLGLGGRTTRDVVSSGRKKIDAWLGAQNTPLSKFGRELLGVAFPDNLYGIQDRYKRVNLIPYGSKKAGWLGGDGEPTYITGHTAEDLDLIPFKFKDTINNKWIIFPAILSGITDTITPEYSSERYIGRPDQVHVYQGANREIGFTFDVYPESRRELIVMWDKLNYLVGLCYPSWAKAAKGGGSGMIAPFVELTIGNLYKDTPGLISSLGFTVQDTSTWEIEKNLKLPKYLQVSCTFIHIGKYPLASTGKHFDLGWTPSDMRDTNFRHFPYRNVETDMRKEFRAVGQSGFTPFRDITKFADDATAAVNSLFS